ncbi:hypothetical protein ABVT39_006608 [Epinephelus coioides]
MGQFSSIPEGYKQLKRMEEGSFGFSVRCMKKDTEETVDLRIPFPCSVDMELPLMTFFKKKNLDKCNIVRFIEPVILSDNRTALVYESLDVTLRDYISTNARLNVHEVRSVVQQLATALNALENIKVIHSDIKLENIMLVDGYTQPLRVKLSNFGRALPSRLAKQGRVCQAVNYRAPEIFLGLPFSESIDMWSLGVMMARLVLGYSLFPGHVDYDVLRQILDLLGYPPHHLLEAGMHLNRYFLQRRNGRWRMKTFKEFGYHWTVANKWYSRISNLDSLDTLQIELRDMMEPAERIEYTDLLKAMLRMDSSERITPSQVLAHPFITRGTLQPSSDSILEALAQPPQMPSVSTSLECNNWLGSDSECHESDSAQIPPGVILVQPAPPERHLALVQDSRQSEGACSIHEALAQPPQMPSVSTSLECKNWLGSDSECHESDSAQIPPGVILVQPAPPERHLALVQDSRQSEGACSILEALAQPPQMPSVSTSLECNNWLGSDSECHESDSAQIPPGVILVQPAPPERHLALVQDSRQSEGACSIHEALAQPPQMPSVSTSLECTNWWDSDSECHESDSAQSVPPGVILVQPAPPECHLALVEDSRQSEGACPLDFLEELFQNSSTESSDMPQEDTESSDTTSVAQKKRKKKKKNCFQRLWDWTKATFTCRGC